MVGIVGVAPQVKIFVIKVLGDDGSGTNAAVAGGIRAAIGYADIISMSLGSSYKDPHLHEAVKEAYNANIPVICAAGNNGSMSLDYPGGFEETISIGALTRESLRAKFSQGGGTGDFQECCIDLLA